MRILIALALSAAAALAQNPSHPLDALTTSEYWTVYDTLAADGKATPDTAFVSTLLHPPDKSAVLAWQPGQPLPRQADVLLLRGAKSYAALVDITARRVSSFVELSDAHAPFTSSELLGADEYIKKDPRIIAAFAKRGITDLRTINCVAVPTAYRVLPEQANNRIGLGSCSQGHRAHHTWGRSIEGLAIHVDVAAKRVLRVIDTGVAPIPQGDTNFLETPENPRPHTTPLETAQPFGQGFRINNGEVSWQNWQFRFRLDPRNGVILNLVRILDKGKPRSVMYEAMMSELFVPYMDTATGWNNRAFIDAGEFYVASGFLKPLRPGLDCPHNAAFFDGFTTSEDGAPKLNARLACLFERNPEGPAWRHTQNGEAYGRPTRQLILRSAAVIGNYDYILDWRFDPDGTIETALGATGIIETKSVTAKIASDHAAHSEPQTGQFVAENTVGVNHDHYFSYRLDLDVDGPANSFMLHRMVPKRLENDPMRKSIWVAQPFLAQREKDAILDIQLDKPSMWMFMNPAVKGAWGYNTAYEVMPGVTAKSLMSADDPTQILGAFSEHQFYVTPYQPNERYASGAYPTSSHGNDGLAFWTKANRPIANTDIVGWYTLGFHHITRAEDWPVMPTMWHSFFIRPFHFFSANPVLDLPKSLSARP